MVANGPHPAWPFWAWLGLLAAVELFLSGIANQLTLGRAYLAAPALAYALHAGTLPQLAVAVALAGFSDLTDGTFARRLGEETSLGGALDPIVDGIFYGAVAVGLALGAAYPVWLAAVVVLRYAMPVVGGAVLLFLGVRPELRHTFFGQVSTTVIACLLGGIALFRGLHVSDWGLVRLAEVGIPLGAVATFGNLAWVAYRSVSGARSPAPGEG
ncbi:MAG: CDP-alcohol phosphatidyltransferase family protein [Candidatus Dormibacteraceae bacterium]